MVEEIITALSRIRWLFVIARNSSFTYKGKAVDVKQVGRELGVRYVLEGSVRKTGNRVRITAQLIDATNGAHLWADRFDGSLEDVFDLQDKVAISVAGVIEPALQAAEIRRSVERPTSDLTAYDLYLRALALYEGGRAGVQRALELLGQAIELDPDYGPALALAAHCHQVLDIIGWAKDPAANRSEGIDLARKALRVARDDPDVLGRAAHAFAYFGEDIDAAIALVDRARELNPSFALGWFRSGWLRLWHGEPDLAIEHFQTSLRLSPRNPDPALFLGIGVGHVLSRRFEEARAMLLRSLQESPNSVSTHRWLAVCCGHMGRIDEAREIINRLPAIVLDAASGGSPYRNPEHRVISRPSDGSGYLPDCGRSETNRKRRSRPSAIEQFGLGQPSWLLRLKKPIAVRARAIVGSRLALAGCTETEIVAITGHSLRDVGALPDVHYLRRDPALAESAIRKLERRTRE